MVARTANSPHIVGFSSAIQPRRIAIGEFRNRLVPPFCTFPLMTRSAFVRIHDGEQDVLKLSIPFLSQPAGLDEAVRDRLEPFE
jgi:hypothetical protein